MFNSYEDYVQYKAYQVRFNNGILLYRVLFYFISFCILVPVIGFYGDREDKAQSNRNLNIAFQYCIEKNTRSYCTSIYNKRIAEIESEYPWYFYGSYEKERK